MAYGIRLMTEVSILLPYMEETAVITSNPQMGHFRP